MDIFSGLGNKYALPQLDKTLSKVNYAAEAAAVGAALASGIAKEPLYGDIPKVYFTGTLPTAKSDGELPLEMTYTSQTKTFTSYVTLKVQGDSSAAYPKKNFNMKMFSDAEHTVKDKHNFKGWGSTSKYCLKANWIDHTHARNVVNAKLWGQMCKARADWLLYPEEIRTAPNCAAVDGFPIQVYVNDVYWGLYTWNIKKDDFMANMDDTNPDHAMMIADDMSAGVMFQSATTNGWTEELTEDPTAISSAWLAMQNFVINSDAATFKSDIENYFYLSSLIDRYIFTNCFLYIGGFAKSQAYFTYNGQKWLSSMYDMDTSWALNWDGASFLSDTLACPSGFEGYKNGSENILINKLIANFKSEIKDRYAYLRATVLSTENVQQEFSDFMDPMADLYALDYAAETGNGEFVNIPSKTTNTPQNLLDHIEARLAYTDTTIPNLT